MYEEHLPAGGLFKESELVSFTLDSVQSYEDLNAPTLEEADVRFGAELANAVKEAHVGEEIGSGWFHVVHELTDGGKVVIKRLRTGKGGDETRLAQEWDRLQKDHHTILTYFGKEFTPDTTFLILDHALEIDSDRQSTQSPHSTYVMIQERALGRKFYSFQKSGQPSPGLQAAAVEYVVRYERMLCDGWVMDHPDDLMINDNPNANRMITILDTNMVGSFEETIESRNSRILLEEFGVDPTLVKTPEDIVQILRTIMPSILGLQTQQAEEFRALDYPMLMAALRPARVIYMISF